MEKFQTFWRGKVVLFCASFLALMILVFVACRQDMKLEQPYLNQAESTKLLSAKIQKAKLWFDDELSKTKAEFGADQMMRGKVEPLWEQAKVVGSSVEVPFFVDKQMLFPTLEQGVGRFGISRLVISPRGNSLKGNIFVLYPSANFKGDLKTLQAARFQEQKFDGILRVLNFKGEKVEAVSVSNGKIGNKLRESIAGRDGIAPRATCVTTITYACGAVCIGGYCGEVTCSTKTVVYECGDNPGGDDDGGGNNDCAGTDCVCYPWIPGCDDGGGTGDTGCTDPDPCVCNPDSPDCECKLKNESKKIPLKVYELPADHKIFIELLLTSVDGAAGTAQTDYLYTPQLPLVVGSISATNEVIRVWHKAPIFPSKPKCGTNVTYICHAVVAYTAPILNGIPTPLTLDVYTSVNLD